MMEVDNRQKKIEQAKKLWVLANRAGSSEYEQNEASTALQNLQSIKQKYGIREEEITDSYSVKKVTTDFTKSAAPEPEKKKRGRRPRMHLRREEIEILRALRAEDLHIRDMEHIFKDVPENLRNSRVRNAIRKPYKFGYIQKADEKKTGVYTITLDGVVRLTLAERGYEI